MKKVFQITTALLFFATFLTAQDDETLFSDVNRIGAFGGPMFEYSSLNGDVETVSGGGGAVVLDDFFLGGYGIGTYELNKTPSTGINEEIRYKHGGFWVGYVPIQHNVVHPFMSAKIGWGKARYKERDINANETLQKFDDSIFVLTPEAGIEINVFSFFRIAASANYRLVNGLDKVDNFSDSDLSGFGGTLTLRFGGFGSQWD